MTPLPLGIPSPPRGVWDLGPIPIRAYAVFIIIGIIVAGYWGNKRFVARGGRPGRITDLAVWMVPFGLVGGRLYHVITDPELYFGNPNTPGENWDPWGVFAIWNGGLGIWGAIALGGLGAYLGCRYYKIPFGPVADALAPGIVIAQAIGRLGNYFNQELFGSPTTVPWALQVFLRTPGGVPGTVADCVAAGESPEFPTTYLKASPEVLCGTFHPTFLYEMVWNVLVALLVLWADRRFRLGHGRAFAVYVAGYTVGRAWIENLRIDHANHILGLRLNVFTAAVVFVLAVLYLVLTRGKGREDAAVVWGPDVGRRGAVAGAGPSGATAGTAATDGTAVHDATDADGTGPDDSPDTEPDTEMTDHDSSAPDKADKEGGVDRTERAPQDAPAE